MRRRHRQHGFSLMEVLLATAILLASLIVLGQVAVVGRQHARDVEQLTAAQMFCRSKLNEVLIGQTPLVSLEATAIDTLPGWSYQVAVSATNQPHLVAITVVAYRDPVAGDTQTPSGTGRKSFALTRWMRSDSRDDERSSEDISTDLFLDADWGGGLLDE